MRPPSVAHIAVAAVVAALLGAVPAGAAATTTDGQLAAAARILRSTPATTFAARAVKRRVVALARRARSHARAGRWCAALDRVDLLRVRLASPATWRRGRIAAGTLRRVERRLEPAARGLLRRAGSRCAQPARTRRISGGRRGDGPYQPLPSAEEVHEQGEDGFTSPPGRDRPIRELGPPAEIRSAAVTSSAPAPLGLFRVTDAGHPPRQEVPQEPTTAVGGGVAWLTGNTSVGFSVNEGRSFTLVDPATILPDNGLPFCCDQVVNYSERYGMFVWLSQYDCAPGTTTPPTSDCSAKGAGANRLRIAVATPGEIRANVSNPSRAWTFWDITPADIGRPGAWFDYNELVINRDHAVITTNLQDAPVGGAVVFRFSLADLAARPASLSFDTFSDTETMSIKPAHGEDATMTYVAGNETLSRVRIWSWLPGGDFVFLHRVDHATIPTLRWRVDASDGSSWYRRYKIFPGHVASAVLHGDDLWLAWGTGRAACLRACGTPREELDFRLKWPSVQIAVFDTLRWRRRGESWIWSRDRSFGFPALAVNRHGDVGIGMLSAPRGGNPVPVAGVLTPGLQLIAPIATSDPLTAGDYTSLRPGSTDASFVLAANTENPLFPGATRRWHFIEYGHGTPPSPLAPQVAIDSPLDGRTFYAGEPISYSATVTDAQWGTLADSAIVWREDGATIGTGPRITRTGTPIGVHAIDVTATNPDGLARRARITVEVVAAPKHAPAVAIVAPADNSEFLVDSRDPATGVRYRTVAFTAKATDPDGDPLTFTWWDSINGSPYAQVAFELSPSLRLDARPSSLGEDTTHDLILVASDGTNRSTASIRVRITLLG
jgi:hypothetical protein